MKGLESLNMKYGQADEIQTYLYYLFSSANLPEHSEDAGPGKGFGLPAYAQDCRVIGNLMFQKDAFTPLLSLFSLSLSLSLFTAILKVNVFRVSRRKISALGDGTFQAFAPSSNPKLQGFKAPGSSLCWDEHSIL